MKKRKLLYSLLFSAALFTACESDDDQELFDEAADVRMDNTLAGYQEQMTTAADEGWKVRYYPDTTSAGGWTFLMRFNEDNSVEMMGDVLPDPEVQEGFYELLRSQGPVLNFGSYLPISELVNPSSAHPESRYGSNDFIFVDQDFSGDIEMVSKRNRSPFVLEPATAEDWSDISQHEQTEQNFVGGDTPPSVYRYFTVTDGSESLVSSMEYDPFLRFMNLLSQGTNAVQATGHGVAFGSDSIFINAPIRFQGEEIERMVYLEETQEFYGESNGVEARLYYSDAPAFFDDDYLYPGGNTHGYLTSSWGYLNDAADNYTTDPYRALFNATDAALAPYGMYLNSAQLHFNMNGTPGDHRILYSTNLGTAHIFLSVERKDNKIYLTTTGIGFTNPDQMGMLTPQDFPIHQFYTDPNGLYVDHVGGFLIYSNPGYTLVSASNPNTRVLLYSN